MGSSDLAKEATPVPGAIGKVRMRAATLRSRLQRLLLWRARQRILEIEFEDRGVALAGWPPASSSSDCSS